MNSAPQAKTYHRVKNYFFYLELGLDILLLAGVQASGLSGQLRDYALRFSSSPFVFRGVYLAVFCLAGYLVHFPLNSFMGYIWEHRFGLSRQRFGAWLKDDLKKVLLSFAVILFSVEVIYVLLARWGGSWWLGAGVFWLFLSLFLARIMPHIIIPLFYKYTDIEDDGLRSRVKELFDKCRVKLKGAYVINFSIKTNKANAFICGLGSRRRVVLTDTLISRFSLSEIEAVLAHELGHYCHRDNIKLIVVNTALVLMAFFAADQILQMVRGPLSLPPMADIASFPSLVLTLLILMLVITPLVNAYSRYLERQADTFSLELTRNPSAFIAMMNKLAGMNLADKNPGRFEEIMFYDHPPIAKRVAMAQAFHPPGEKKDS